MRIDELKKIAEENDYKWLENKHNQLDHKLEFRRNVGVLENIINQIAIREGIENRIFFNINYCNEKDLNMIKASLEYAETPPEDRQEIKKYFYKHNFIQTKGNSFTYLAIRQRPSISYPVLQGSSRDIFEYKVEFTDEEIEKAQKEHGIFLDDFKKIEVEE